MSFELDLRKFAKKAGDKAEANIRKVCLDLTSDIVKNTPVDTGRLRGNWQASIGAPASGELEAKDKSGAPTIRKANTAISKAAGNIFYLTNNLPYAVVAEYGLWKTGEGATEKTTRDGYSVQAAYGMVRLNYERIRLTLK